MPITSSLQVGRVVTEGDPDDRRATHRQWTSAFNKRPVEGPLQLTMLGLVGDHVADTKHHGGPDKAVLCYPAAHYSLWQASHPQLNMGPGGFGENITLAEADETTICIGDRFAVGDCRVEVSQPRQPCWKISRRWSDKSLLPEVVRSGRTGWYLRVIQEGTLRVGDRWQRTASPNPQWTIARANDVLFGREVDRLAVIELMSLPQLAAAWKESVA